MAHQIESYHVYVDGVLKVTVKANERTRALVEGVDSNRVSINWHHQLLYDNCDSMMYISGIRFQNYSHIESVCAASLRIVVHHAMQRAPWSSVVIHRIWGHLHWKHTVWRVRRPLYHGCQRTRIISMWCASIMSSIARWSRAFFVNKSPVCFCTAKSQRIVRLLFLVFIVLTNFITFANRLVAQHSISRHRACQTLARSRPSTTASRTDIGRGTRSLHRFPHIGQGFARSATSKLIVLQSSSIDSILDTIIIHFAGHSGWGWTSGRHTIGDLATGQSTTIVWPGYRLRRLRWWQKGNKSTGLLQRHYFFICCHILIQIISRFHVLGHGRWFTKRRPCPDWYQQISRLESASCHRSHKIPR